jgi:oligoendopeptidase F
MLRAVKKSLELFREENIPLQTEIQVEQQKYQSITGAMSVHIGEKEYTLEQASVFLKDTDRSQAPGSLGKDNRPPFAGKTVLDTLFRSSACPAP